MAGESGAAERRLWYVTRSFRAGKGRKVHSAAKRPSFWEVASFFMWMGAVLGVAAEALLVHYGVVTP